MTAYFKLSGGGNDFLALAEPETDPTPGQIRRWCARGTSEGADGLFVLRRESSGVRMTYSNADGQRAALCLNGTRCAARLAFHLDWATDRTIVATDAGDYRATDVSEHAIELEMARPEAPERALDLVVGEDSWHVTPITFGVPHLILQWEGSLAEAPVAQLGPRLRSHPEFGEAGTNVDFVRFPSANRLEIRSFERGVEAETLACGTGVLAAVAVGLELRQRRLAGPLGHDRRCPAGSRGRADLCGDRSPTTPRMDIDSGNHVRD
jgi:diaminopimelate epimerase